MQFKAAELFGEQVRPIECIRVRNYQAAEDLALDPIVGNLDEPVEKLNFSYKVFVALSLKFTMQPLLLEVKEPNGEFPFYDPKAMAVKVFVYTVESKTFSAHQININKQASVGELKVNIIFSSIDALQAVFEEKFSIPVSEQLVLFEKSYSGWNTPPYEKLTDPEAKLRKDHFVWDGAKLYLEYLLYSYFGK